MHRYSFPKADTAHLILVLVHGIYNHTDKNVWTFVRDVSSRKALENLNWKLDETQPPN